MSLSQRKFEISDHCPISEKLFLELKNPSEEVVLVSCCGQPFERVSIDGWKEKSGVDCNCPCCKKSLGTYCNASVFIQTLRDFQALNFQMDEMKKTNEKMQFVLDHVALPEQKIPSGKEEKKPDATSKISAQLRFATAKELAMTHVKIQVSDEESSFPQNFELYQSRKKELKLVNDEINKIKSEFKKELETSCKHVPAESLQQTIDNIKMAEQKQISDAGLNNRLSQLQDEISQLKQLINKGAGKIFERRKAIRQQSQLRLEQNQELKKLERYSHLKSLFTRTNLKLGSAPIIQKIRDIKENERKATLDLWVALRNRNLKNVEAALKKNANPEWIAPFSGGMTFTALQYAVVKFDSELVGLLLKYGADANRIGGLADQSSRTTILFHLLKHSNFKFSMENPDHSVIAISLASAMSPEAVNTQFNYKDAAKGETLLTCAIHTKNVGLIHVLLDRGADPRIQDAQGLDAIQYMFSLGFENEEVMSALQEKFTQFEQDDNNKRKSYPGRDAGLPSARKPKI